MKGSRIECLHCSYVWVTKPVMHLSKRGISQGRSRPRQCANRSCLTYLRRENVDYRFLDPGTIPGARPEKPGLEQGNEERSGSISVPPHRAKTEELRVILGRERLPDSSQDKDLEYILEGRKKKGPWPYR